MSILPISDLLYINISTIVIWGVLLEDTLSCKFWTMIKGIFIISCSIGIIETILETIFLHLIKKPLTPMHIFLVSNIFLIIVFLLINSIKEKEFITKKELTYSILIIFMILMATSLIGIISGLRYAAPYVNNKTFSMASNILIIFSYLSIVILGMFIIYTRNANTNYKHLLETEALLRSLQKNHYEMMLAKERRPEHSAMI
ncbi:hypothetical protein [Anaerotaenia torta]|uniref:hypothetical protein n=1 Tax=Anaerotaenia torta TaxID=433293 RepID=UPI003D23D976